MRIASIIITLLAMVLIVVNATKINFEAPFAEDSLVAMITLLASACAILLVQILRISKKIEGLAKKRR